MMHKGEVVRPAVTCVMAVSLGLSALAGATDSRVEFRDCPKCDKRVRIDLAAGKAYVNLSRLEGADREAVAVRAARLLDAAKRPLGLPSLVIIC